MKTMYTFAGEPATLVKISLGARTAIYWIRVANQLISTCLADQRFQVREPAAR